ncbi:MAG TPA: enoyl-CoA hydratase/isomerase family protein [Kofleriaceae bacterium]|jgi:enoyl-CoA hydratase/carnithine racemase
MTTEAILIRSSVQDGVAVVELNNPPANAYSYEMFRQLDDAILAARMDESVHVIVLRGAGDKFFCAGADIAMLDRVTPEFKYYFCLHANETLLRLENTPKLVIAALNGHCVGGGLEIAMAADLRIGKAGGGKVGLPEVSLGVLPGTGGTQRLARLLGKAKAIELMVKGDRISMEEAHQLGLVNWLLPAEDFWPRALETARSFCPPGKASHAVGAIKRAVQTGRDLGIEAGLALERELQQRLFTSEDAREGVRAYVENRAPSFKGR